ncbi:hypothetical protein [Oceanobacillus caeni]|nr:hypothetical protein [Oceanobacillus caeni]MED4473653.1 hypothetical protein [Oceanobacillus caeni]
MGKAYDELFEKYALALNAMKLISNISVQLQFNNYMFSESIVQEKGNYQ